MGLNQYEWKQYTDLLIKANSQQLIAMSTLMVDEAEKRRNVMRNRLERTMGVV